MSGQTRKAPVRRPTPVWTPACIYPVFPLYETIPRLQSQHINSKVPFKHTWNRYIWFPQGFSAPNLSECNRSHRPVPTGPVPHIHPQCRPGTFLKASVPRRGFPPPRRTSCRWNRSCTRYRQGHPGGLQAGHPPPVCFNSFFNMGNICRGGLRLRRLCSEYPASLSVPQVFRRAVLADTAGGAERRHSPTRKVTLLVTVSIEHGGG